MIAKAKCVIFVYLLTVIHPVAMSQTANRDDLSVPYAHAVRLIDRTCDSLELFLSGMAMNDTLSEVQQAKIDLIRMKLQVLNEMDPMAAPVEIIPADTAGDTGSPVNRAQHLIVQSRPDEAIPLLLEYLQGIDSQSDSAVYAMIWLAEAYRQKREYDKGIGLIFDVLRDPSVRAKNKAFAYNRMAALYNEKHPFEGNRPDSVMKYSRLCIELAGKQHLTEYVAASENELGSVYLNLHRPDSAVKYISLAARKFLRLNMIPQTINVYINLSRAYADVGKLKASKDILLEALDLGTVENDRNLFKHVYYNLAVRSHQLGEEDEAYTYLLVAYNLMSRFFDDRIQRQINEMSARYDLQLKETKIKEEEHKSRTYRMQKNYLIVIAVISISLLLVIVVLFRLKSRAYQKLVRQHQKSIRLEKQVEDNLIRLSEHDIKTKAGAHDRNSELALRLEKFLAEEKPYLWSDVNLEEFCKKLNTNRTYLSKLINDTYKMSFYDLLFEYRIKAALEYLNNPEFKHLSVEGIGELTGFKSNSNFYKRFKSVVGMTPNQFRERALKS